MTGGKDTKMSGEALEPMRAIGEALVRTFQNVADEKVPDHLLNLLERLGAGETPGEGPPGFGMISGRDDGPA
jgi:hypothetical protein